MELSLKNSPTMTQTLDHFTTTKDNKHFMEFQECYTYCIVIIHVCCTLSFNLCSFSFFATITQHLDFKIIHNQRKICIFPKKKNPQ